MELSSHRKTCRICITETDFNISLFSNYSRNANLLKKITTCLKLEIEETDYLDAICYKCAENIERYYDFVNFVKKAQTKLPEFKAEPALQRHNVRLSSYVREQVVDADYTFSVFELLEDNENKKEIKPSSPLFSYFSPITTNVWKTPNEKHDQRNDVVLNRQRQCKTEKAAIRLPKSRDLFDSQSQNIKEPEPRSLDWNLTPDDSIMKQIQDKWFRRSDF